MVMKIVPAPHPTMLDDAVLLKQCQATFGRASGPGGQHRNKVETAATLVHTPTGLSASARERRSQAQNRGMALRRLRVKLAREVRTRIDSNRHQPGELWRQRRQGRTISVNPKHRDYPVLLAEALDVVHAKQFDVAGAAGVLGVSMSQLAKLIRHDKLSFAQVNDGRTKRGMPALK